MIVCHSSQSLVGSKKWIECPIQFEAYSYLIFYVCALLNLIVLSCMGLSPLRYHQCTSREGGFQVLYKLSSGALSSVLSPWLLGTLLVCEAEVCSCWAHDPSFWRSFCSQQHHPCWLSFTSAPADCIPRSLCQGLQPASSIGCSLPIFTEGSPCSWLAHQLSASALLNHATVFHNYSKVYILQFAVTYKISNYLNVYFYINI